jgi:hypothetical protein
MKSIEHTEYTALVTKSGDFYVGFVLEVPGAMAWSKNEDDLKVDLTNAILAIHRADKNEQELIVRNMPAFVGARTERLQLCV